MTSLTIDTHEVAETLKRHGFSDAQTKGILQAAKEASLNSLVTKEYMKEYMDHRLEKMELRLTVRLGAMVFALGGLMIAVMVAIKFMG